jgi:hypothetical protein
MTANMTVASAPQTFAARLGITANASVLRRRILRLMKEFPADEDAGVEAWLMELANLRGARSVQRRLDRMPAWIPPSVTALSDEELTAALLLPETADHPQLIRLAAQFISRGALELPGLIQLARRERLERILAELARGALQAEPEHAAWRTLFNAFHGERPFRVPVIHWTRLAEPVMLPGEPNAHGWRLAS